MADERFTLSGLNKTTRRGIFSVTFIALFLLLLYALGLIFSPFIMPILWAAILAKMAYPLYQGLHRYLGNRENIAAGILTFAVLALAVAPAAYIVVLLIQESISAYEQIVEWAKTGGVKQTGEYISHLPIIGKYSQEWIGRLVVSHKEFEGSIVEGGKVVSGFLLAQAGDIAKNAVAFITDFLVMLFTLFFLFRDGDKLYERLYRSVPLDDAHKATLFDRLNTTVTAVVRGTLLTAIAQGAVAGLTYWLLGVPFPVFLGAISAVLSLLPFGGTFLVWGPVAVYLFMTDAVWKGFVMIAVGGGLVGIMDNIIQPLLIGSGAELPVLFLFFASIGGLAYFGFIGLFLGPILLAIAIAAYRIYEEEYKEEESAIVQP
ncbi:MAG TPA: AI-2E family transporter [Nitrospiraceae bacterium]|nr:AI-2E family transporter [Nitrospiraceae bacterium]